MSTFGIISEGPSDQIVIENILCGYFSNPDLIVRHLQPMHDATDSDSRKYGGWMRVFEYCRSQYIIEALEQNDYLIIQIDTDCCEEKHFGVSRRDASGKDRTPEEIIKSVAEKFEDLFSTTHGENFAHFKHRLLFAICVEELECWLLPLYHNDKIKASIRSCIAKLNPKLEAAFGVYIDKSNKSPVLRHYDRFSRPFLKRKTIDAIYDHNVSLKVFFDVLGKIET